MAVAVPAVLLAMAVGLVDRPDRRVLRRRHRPGRDRRHGRRAGVPRRHPGAGPAGGPRALAAQRGDRHRRGAGAGLRPRGARHDARRQAEPVRRGGAVARGQHDPSRRPTTCCPTSRRRCSSSWRWTCRAPSPSRPASSFLGLGVPPPSPSWGALLADGFTYVLISPWAILAASLALMLIDGRLHHARRGAARRPRPQALGRARGEPLMPRAR